MKKYKAFNYFRQCHMSTILFHIPFVCVICSIIALLNNRIVDLFGCLFTIHTSMNAMQTRMKYAHIARIVRTLRTFNIQAYVYNIYQ